LDFIFLFYKSKATQSSGFLNGFKLHIFDESVERIENMLFIFIGEGSDIIKPLEHGSIVEHFMFLVSPGK